MGDQQVTVPDDPVFERYPDAWVDRDSLPFFKGLLQRRLLINRCQDCSNWFQPPWPTCPACWSSAVRPTDVSGRGIVYTFTVPPRNAAPLGVIELEEQEGLRASGPIIDCVDEDVHVGMPVELVWRERADTPVPAFRPRAAS